MSDLGRSHGVQIDFECDFLPSSIYFPRRLAGDEFAANETQQDARVGVRTSLNCPSTEVVTGNFHLPQQFLSFRRDSLVHCDNALNLILHSWEIGEWRIGPESQRTH